MAAEFLLRELWSSKVKGRERVSMTVSVRKSGHKCVRGEREREGEGGEGGREGREEIAAICH